MFIILCQLSFRQWANLDIKAEISSEDLSKSSNVLNLLSENNRLGPVEGVYVLASTVTEKDVKKLTELVNNLDWATRNICKSLRYVISFINIILYSVLLIAGTHCKVRRRFKSYFSGQTIWSAYTKKSIQKVFLSKSRQSDNYLFLQVFCSCLHWR